ncbi:molybdopterin molybdotransferase MoeA [Sinimarinibacterium thermocellulolyticum]|uniref:Molybdopterin molybdenumtransferase n=1 Tax=Sinimarinibacterium thermocellulolyticum TaxID=3170016 RepID=A0ABV2ACH9_9GAMM
MIGVDEALSRIAGALPELPAETIATRDALGRVLAAKARTAHPLPLFDQSAVDGYAVRHADVQRVPVTLPLSTTVAASAQAARARLAPGTAARIFTGGLLPLDADTVVRQELTRRKADAVTILKAVAPGTDLRRQGEELAKGSVVAAAGARVTPGLLAALALAGAHQVQVRRQPRIAVLISGDEVVPHGAPLKLGQVPDANGPLIGAQLAQWGVPPSSIDYVADREDAVRTALASAFERADLVLSSGGVSVGDFDFIPSVAEKLGAERLLWKVAQKPGMPLYVARRGASLLFGLPGNPASVLVNLQVYVRDALERMLGRDPRARWRHAIAPARLHREQEKTFWLRAIVSADAQGQLRLETLSGQASHMLGNLARANALVRVPGMNEAERVDTLRWLSLYD